MPRTCSLLGVLCLLAAVSGVGCGGNTKTVKVAGTVTLDGAPLPGATVIFMPLEKGSRSASGRTDEDGSFRLTTFSTDDGAPPGEYKVVVKHSEGSKETIGTDPSKFSEKDKAEFFMKMSPKGQQKEAQKKTRSPLPAIYGDVDKTPLKQVVPPTGKVTLELRSTAR